MSEPAVAGESISVVGVHFPEHPKANRCVPSPASVVDARPRRLPRLAVGVGLLSVLNGPSANAGELRDRQEAVHKKIAKADHELEESSTALRQATRALSHAREQLTEARAELGDVRARLEIARQRDEEMKAALSAAEARLEQARADVATGKDALQTAA